MRMRSLTDKGIEEFKNYIQRLKHGVAEDPPVKSLSKYPFSKEFDVPLDIDVRTFSTRLDLAEYLSDRFAIVDRPSLVGQYGVWSWLALLLFNQLCPVSDDGHRKVRETARYVCSSDYTDYYRHLVAASWDIFYLHGQYSKVFLSCPLYIHNDFIEQLASRQDIITIKGLIEAVDKLYWRGNGKGGPKRNATNRKVLGSLRRLISLVDQLRLTYDLHAMQGDDILSLLPKEFDLWKNE